MLTPKSIFELNPLIKSSNFTCCKSIQLASSSKLILCNILASVDGDAFIANPELHKKFAYKPVYVI